MTPNAFRRLALAFDGAAEKAHMGHPDFRAANGKIFATLHADQKHGMVKLTPQQQRQCIGDSPGAFTPAAGAWGLGGATIVTLAAIDAERLGEAMTLAWQNVQTPSGRTPTKTKTRRPPGPSRRSR